MHVRGDSRGQAPRVAGHPHTSSREEGVDLPNFPPSRAHLLLTGVYGDQLHHNDGSHLDGGVADGVVWQSC